MSPGSLQNSHSGHAAKITFTRSNRQEIVRNQNHGSFNSVLLRIKIKSISTQYHFPSDSSISNWIQASHSLATFNFSACADQLWGCLSRRLANCDRMLTDEAVDQLRCSLDLSWTLGCRTCRTSWWMNAANLVSRIGLEPTRTSECSNSMLLGFSSELGNVNLLFKYFLNACQASRTWKDEISKVRVQPSGGLLEDATANHFFMCMQERGRLVVRGMLEKMCSSCRNVFVCVRWRLQTFLAHFNELWIVALTGVLLKVQTFTVW